MTLADKARQLSELLTLSGLLSLAEKAMIRAVGGRTKLHGAANIQLGSWVTYSTGKAYFELVEPINVTMGLR
ncbi:hypothetical protein PILCRDRAFT_821856 [Piloderma croceum F 1598]|uniref:Uncharacterized protein n=1 Tax=Piloderma croceum (strain F 1598) TaxID=765440 RepID=A0A0C3F8D4_PILCF|nr:hypothetical protein PILCRDRAFT_821856 [Piloderma croceum F 1598]